MKIFFLLFLQNPNFLANQDVAVAVWDIEQIFAVLAKNGAKRHYNYLWRKEKMLNHKLEDIRYKGSLGLSKTTKLFLCHNSNCFCNILLNLIPRR